MARLVDQIIGHQEILKRFLSSFESDHSAQTYLFVGPQGVGKKMSAMALAQALICERSRQACGQCPSCLRLMAGHHENLLMICPEGNQIKVDQAREVVEFLNLATWRGHRVVIIDQAHLLNPQSANSLLKTLEEPPVGTYFFLLATSTAGVLPTIRSRSCVVQFRPLALAEIAKINPAPDWILRASRGSFSKLQELQDIGEQELRVEAALTLQKFIANEDFLLANDWRDQFKDRARAQKIAHYWIGFLRDALYVQLGQKNQVLNSDQTGLLTTLAKLKPQLIYFLMEHCFRLLAEVQINRDWQLAIEELWVRGQNASLD